MVRRERGKSRQQAGVGQRKEKKEKAEEGSEEEEEEEERSKERSGQMRTAAGLGGLTVG